MDFLVILTLLDQYIDSTLKSKCGCGPSCLVREISSEIEGVVGGV